MVKSPREIELIRKATRLSGIAIIEAMRSTEPGIKEADLDALAKLVFHRGGAQGDGYYSLIATGPNAWYPHYHRGKRDLRDGELLLMDYAPDVSYYSSDVTRMWPVNGRFNEWQRDLYGFYLALLQSHPGVDPAGRRRGDDARGRLPRWIGSSRAGPSPSPPTGRRRSASSPSSRKAHKGCPRASATESGWRFTTSACADGTLVPGMVFTIEPQFRVPEEKIYVRLEDVIVVTENGAEVLTDFLPMEMDQIEALMREEGLLQIQDARGKEKISP